MKKKNIPWARLLARVFNIDVETCSKCGGKMKIIAAIEDPKVIRKILDHNGFPTKPPSLHLRDAMGTKTKPLFAAVCS